MKTTTTTTAHNPKRYKVGKYYTTLKPVDVPFDLSDAQRATEQAFDLLNDRLFGGNLERVIITLQSSRGSYGHCSVAKIWNNGSVNNSKREMVHAFNLQRGIIDCNPSNQYHNKKFKKLAESVGLAVTKEGHRGYCRTRVAMSILDGVEPVAEQAISELRLQPFWQKQHFDFQRGSGIGQRATGTDTGTDETKPKPLGGNSKMKKWFCGCTNIRCAVELNATCNNCGNQFELA